MIWGEHLHADEIAVTCQCGIAASVEVFDHTGRSRGWFCRQHSYVVRDQLRREEKLAKAIVKKGLRP